MRGILLLLLSALIFGALAVLLGQTAGVEAIGAPTDNATIPDVPSGGQFTDEIRPLVNYVLLGPSSQSKNTPPNFVSGFIGTSEKDKFKVTADENWYLEVDINTLGWLYIYEYFPAGGDSQGEWIVYKWQLLQSGLWRLGPFAPAENELEGQHIYRIWFYSDGQWAVEDPNTPQNNIIYWTYWKGQTSEQPAEQIPPKPPTAPLEEATLLDRLHRFITMPAVLVLGPSVLVVIVMFSLYMSRSYASWGRTKNITSSIAETELEEPSAALPSAVTSAKIALPNGVEIQLVGNSRVIGRGDVARALDLDELALISRRHFEVKSEEEQFYIQDLGSANGTKLNGEDIRGKGPVSLNNDDVIEPAGAIYLKFYIL